MAGIARRNRRRNDYSGSAEEQQKYCRKYHGDRHQREQHISHQGVTIVWTTTPEVHDGPHDERCSTP